MRTYEVPYATYRNEAGDLAVRDGCLFPVEDMLRIGLNHFQGISTFQAQAIVESKHEAYKAQFFGPKATVDTSKWEKVGSVRPHLKGIIFPLFIRKKQGFDT
jgi:hypothetical protein